MAELIALAEKIGAVGFPTLLVLILAGSYYEIWMWGRQVREREADLRKQLFELEIDIRSQLDEAKADAKEWKGVALQGLRIVETKSKDRE